MSIKKAFTLIEILVVIAIMGFLAAMVAPKLSGILGSSEYPIDEANQKKLTKVINDFESIKSRLPRDLVNLVHENNSTGIYEMIENEEDMNRQREFSHHFYDNLAPTLHILNAQEVSELKRLGISFVRNYIYTYPSGNQARNRNNILEEGDAVLMVGGGSIDNNTSIVWNRNFEITDDDAGNISFDDSNNVALDNAVANSYAYIVNPNYIGRIILGISDDSELVKDGYIETVGHSPIESREGKVKFLNYLLVLPRLKASVERIDVTTGEIRKYNNEINEGYGQDQLDLQRSNKYIVISPQGEKSQDRDFEYGVKIQ